MMALGNAIIVAVFGTLAWLFKKWWIVLFAGLFMMSSKDSDNN